MSQIVTQNPGSSEIQSPLIAGITEGLNKLSSVLNLKTGTLEDVQLTAVPIDNDEKNKNRIFEANFGNRLWLSSPTPVIKKNGSEITQSGSNFTIDYIGGSVTFPVESKPSDGDIITVSATYIIADSESLNAINNTLSAVQTQSNKYKGNYDNVEALQLAYSSAQNGDYAIVFEPLAVYAWKNDGWYDTRSIEDLSNYYNKEETNNLLNQKEPKISSKGSSTSDDNYYWGGRKTWQDLFAKVRSVTLTGLSTASDSVISATDTVLTAIGKLQSQVSKNTQKAYLSGTGAPSTSTVGSVGQRYVNTSTSDEYICEEVSGGTYTWKLQVKSVNGKTPSAAGGNVQLTAFDVGAVASFNGRTGAVMPESGDYDADMVGALSTDGGAVTGVTKFSKGVYAYRQQLSGNALSRIELAKISILNSYVDVPIQFIIFKRGYGLPSFVTIRFQADTTTDPDLFSISYSGNVDNSAYAVAKISPSTWSLYVKTYADYDEIAVARVDTDWPYMDGRISIQFVGNTVSSLPDGAVYATYKNISSSLASPVNIGSASFDGTQNITLDQIGAMPKGVYSTDEVATGQLWEDASGNFYPIYRKKFFGVSVPDTAGFINTPLPGLTTEYVREMLGVVLPSYMIRKNGAHSSVNIYNSTSASWAGNNAVHILTIETNQYQAQVIVSGEETGRSMVICVEYTKLSDQPVSV